jgi:superfamily II DNA helicase RecQ
MKYRFFRIPIQDPAAETEALNRFLSERRIVSVDREFVADGQNSFWTLSVAYVEGSAAAEAGEGSRAGRKPKVDYREVLDERDFATFAALRTLRKELAEREGVPAYALFTNEQLAAMVENQVRTAADLAAIEGVGKARVEKYGAAFLGILNERAAAPDTAEDSRAASAD